MKAESTKAAAVLCVFVMACSHHEDTKPRSGWLRPLQPRLTGATKWQPCRTQLTPGHIVEDAVCGTPRAVTPAKAVCDDILSTHDEAVRLLVERPACIDDAITALERFARVDPAAGSDLAAAYYTRAQQDDHASDLLSALDAANRAVARAPRLVEARFNQALALEAAGLRTEAIAAWDQVSKTTAGQWASEAREHHDRLANVPDAAAQWQANLAQLPAALGARDRNTVARLISPFPFESEQILEEVLLPQWAANPTTANLEGAQLLADELTRISGNPLPLDVIHAVTASPPAKLNAIRQGLLAFREAKLAERSIAGREAGSHYADAVRLLEDGRNPLSLLAGIGLARAISFGQEARALSMLDSLEGKAQARGYLQVVARIEALRGYLLSFQSRFMESFAELEKALKTYATLGDTEDVAATRVQWIGIYRAVGQNELSYREALPMTRHLTNLVDAQKRHTVLGDTAATALALGHPEAALLYQNAGIALLRRQLLATAPERIDELTRLQTNLSIAFRERARIDLDLSHYNDAQSDLNEAVRRNANATAREKDQNNDIRDAIQARIEEVKGEALLHVNPEQAASAYSRALDLIAGNSFHTFRASLLTRRAVARQLLGRAAEERADLGSAVEELRAEEAIILERRKRGEAEPLWSPYFGRFQDTYRLLIGQFAANGEPEEAFSYAERARGLEPLNLVLQTTVVPAAFRGLTSGEPLSQAEIQRNLPPDTFLIEFCILGGHTCAWVLSRDHFELIELNVRNDQIERWTARLQRAARSRNETDLQSALLAPSHELLARPLKVIRQLHPAATPPLLVFIPDGALHGLPFTALRNPDSGHYLIEEARVSTAGSATLYIYSLLRDRELPRRPHPSVLLIRDPAYDPKLPFAQGLGRLRGAKDESDEIAAIYAPQVRVLRDEQATVDRFLSEVRDCDLFHFAGHAVSNPQEPFRSQLLLAPAAHDPGVLEAAMLVQKLRADHTRLAILSTCSSAGGLPVGPEGVAPLVRPLIGAGIPAVIGSLWDIDDATATELLVSFHRSYRKGRDAANALRDAQLHMLQSPNAGYASVLAWAPFELIGNASSPFGPMPEIKGEPP
jgi:CHAT domain-containing protein